MNGAMDLPGRVRKARKDRGWTQAELAERAGVSLGTYQTFETRKSVPTPENLREILDAVGVREIDDETTGEVGEADICPTCHQSIWPEGTRAFLDVMGAYLAVMDEAERLRFMHAETRRIFEGR